jgi:hypothetical protein
VRFLQSEGRAHRLIVIGVSLVALAVAAFLIQRIITPDPKSTSANPTGGPPVSAPAAEAGESPSPEASPTASPSPSPSTQRPNLPPRPNLPIPAGFPTPNNTGWQHTGVTLTVVPNLYIASTPGEVLDAKDFQGGLKIAANNVTVKRSRVQCGDCLGLWVNQKVRNTLVEDVEITSRSKTSRIVHAITAGKTYNLTVRRVHVHDTMKGFEYGYSALFEDNYVDDEYNPTDDHSSALGGAVMDDDMTLVVRHNWIAGKLGNNNSAALLYYVENNNVPRKINVTIEQNIVNGGSYAMWLSSDEVVTGTVTVRSNLFGTKYSDKCGAYNTHFIENNQMTAFTWENNKWYAPGMAKDGTEVTRIIQY